MMIKDSPEKKQIDEITFKHISFYFQINMMDNQDEITAAIWFFFVQNRSNLFSLTSCMHMATNS